MFEIVYYWIFYINSYLFYVLGETIPDAAIREVFEETGLKTKFESLVALRHSQGAAFGCCDIYFIVELSPESDDYTLKCDEREIEACQWMKVCFICIIFYYCAFLFWGIKRALLFKGSPLKKYKLSVVMYEILFLFCVFMLSGKFYYFIFTRKLCCPLKNVYFMSNCP